MCSGRYGITGRLGFEVNGRMAILQIDDGRTELVTDGGPVQAKLLCRSEEDFRKLASGELNPLVASLQGRLAIEGTPVATDRGLTLYNPIYDLL